MDFQTLTEDQFSALTEDTFAALLESGGTSGGDSGGGTCLYDATAIAAIKSTVDTLATSVATLITAVSNLQSDITAIKARMPQTGTISTLTAGDVWDWGLVVGPIGFSANNLLADIYGGLYDIDYPDGGITWRLSTMDTSVTAIKAKTDNLPAEPAAKSDVQITVNADGIDVPTVSEIWNHTSRTLTSTIPTVSDIQSGLAKTSDLSSLAKTSDLSGLAKPGDAMTLTTAYDAAKTAAQPSDVQLTTTTETVNVTTQTVDISGLATSTNLSALQTTANAIKTQTDKIPATAVTPSDITALRTHGDSNWSTATGFATPADVAAADLTQVYSALSLISALLGHWTVSGNILTTYDDSGAVLKTYALTRDSKNNIISISEA